MPKYLYQAKTLEGRQKTGTIEAKDTYDLAKILKQEGYVLVSFSLEKKSQKIDIISFIPFLNGVSLSAKLMFTRNLRVMVSAGVSLPRALNILSEQTKSNKLKKILLEIKEEIIKGRSFSDTLKSYPDIFSELFINMIKVGEETGTLEEVLNVLGSQMEKDYQLRSRIKGAMVYPAVIVFVMIIIGILMLVMVIPKLSQVFEELGIELPLTTRIIIASGNFLASFWYLIPIFFLLIVSALRFFLKTKSGKLTFSFISLKIPIIKGIVMKTNSAYTIRTLSSLITAGVPIVRSLEIVSGSLTNIYYKKAILEVSEKVKKGSKLGECFDEHKDIYPSLVNQMIRVGEETGETSEILKKLAEFFEDEVLEATKNLSAVIEPFLMVIIGAAVALFAISMIQPIYGIMETL